MHYVPYIIFLDIVIAEALKGDLVLPLELLKTDENEQKPHNKDSLLSLENALKEKKEENGFDPSHHTLKITESHEEIEERKQRELKESFEKMLMFVTVVNQVDSYLTGKAKSFVRILNKLIESEEDV